MNTTSTEILPTGTKVTVAIEFADTFHGTINDVEIYNGEVSYLITSVAGYQDWYLAADVTA